MQATQAPQPEAEFQDGIEVEEEDEPAPKRKKKTSVAAEGVGAQFHAAGSVSSAGGPRRRAAGLQGGRNGAARVAGQSAPAVAGARVERKTRFYEKRSAMSDEELARLEALGVRWPRANSRAAVCFR